MAGYLFRPATFAALDFETADRGADSACALSVVRCEQGRVVCQVTRLLRPPRRNIQFTWIHGIRWADVAEAPTFADAWRDFAPLIAGVEFLAAHNAGFDRKVLLTCLTKAGFPLPETPFGCTVRLARQAWSVRPTRLPDVCQFLKLPLQHHQAASDAEACARIVLAAEPLGLKRLKWMLKKPRDNSDSLSSGPRRSKGRWRSRARFRDSPGTSATG